jgi:hypothetical protein
MTLTMSPAMVGPPAVCVTKKAVDGTFFLLGIERLHQCRKMGSDLSPMARLPLGVERSRHHQSRPSLNVV